MTPHDDYTAFLMDFGDLFADRVRNDRDFAERLWGSMANVEWQKNGKGYGMSFRYAGRRIAELRGDHSPFNYMSLYCCVPDGVVDPEVAVLFATRGYTAETNTARWLIGRDQTEPDRT